MAEVLIRAAGLGKHYGGDENAIRVLENLDLEIRRAERVAIVGESGVGKSTLLHILGTLDRPSEGKVFLDEQDLFALPDLELAALRNREIGRKKDLLVNQDDAATLRVDRSRQCHGFTVDLQFAARRLQMAGKQLHESRLAGTVLADDCVNLAGIQR